MNFFNDDFFTTTYKIYLHFMTAVTAQTLKNTFIIPYKNLNFLDRKQFFFISFPYNYKRLSMDKHL